MKKYYEISEEEFEAIKEAITSVLQLWLYDIISAKNEQGHEISMSKETFWESLKGEFKMETTLKKYLATENTNHTYGKRNNSKKKNKAKKRSK